jgi:hypothetical protein
MGLDFQVMFNKKLLKIKPTKNNHFFNKRISKAQQIIRKINIPLMKSIIKIISKTKNNILKLKKIENKSETIFKIHKMPPPETYTMKTTNMKIENSIQKKYIFYNLIFNLIFFILICFFLFLSIFFPFFLNIKN